jgi:polyisoprenoid-binding protein YceI
MNTATLTRPDRAATSPHTGSWVIDATRAVVALSGKASFLAPTMSARFHRVEGAVEISETAGGLSGAVDVSVDVTSITTGNPVWDDVITSFDPFDAQHFPVALYRSSRVRWTDRRATIDGALTLHGVTKSVPLTASYDMSRDGTRMLVRAAGSIDRSAFGIAFDVPGAGKLVPRTMRLAIDADVVLAP